MAIVYTEDVRLVEGVCDRTEAALGWKPTLLNAKAIRPLEHQET